jgi:hypothetical protein
MYLALLVCAATSLSTGCTYQSGQSATESIAAPANGLTSNATFTLPDPLVVNVMPVNTGIQSSKHMPKFGECSFNQANQYSAGDVRYLGPMYPVPGLAADEWRVHFEGGLTTSWPRDTYLAMKSLTPGVKDTSVKIFAVTKESFVSLMQNNLSLKNFVMNTGVLPMVDMFYVTSYECMPLGGIK